MPGDGRTGATGLETKVCVVGIWHLGAVVSACLADLGYRVVGVDPLSERVANLNRGVPPLFEPGLAEVLTANLTAGRLRYVTDLREGVAGADYVVLAFDTPVNEKDEVDLREIFATAEAIASHLKAGAVVLVQSQVPVGTCERIGQTIRETNPASEAGIAYSPENLRLGRAVERFRRPAMIVIGADEEATLSRVEGLFAPIVAPKLRMNLRTAEMTKHAINAFLATSISFANELASVCDEVGADALRLSGALKHDERIGPNARLDPGLGFSGGTLARDLRVLQGLGRSHRLATPLIDAVLAVNARQNGLILSKLGAVYGSLRDRIIAVLGLTYTPQTSTLRRSAAVEIIGSLVAQGARVRAHDPKADPDEVRRHTEFQFCADPYAAAEGADALILVTEWPEFKGLDFRRIRSVMRRPLVLDAKNMLASEDLAALGFVYLGVGRGSGASRPGGAAR